jgi:hypothetical protein
MSDAKFTSTRGSQGSSSGVNRETPQISIPVSAVCAGKGAVLACFGRI